MEICHVYKFQRAYSPSTRCHTAAINPLSTPCMWYSKVSSWRGDGIKEIYWRRGDEPISTPVHGHVHQKQPKFDFSRSPKMWIRLNGIVMRVGRGLGVFVPCKGLVGENTYIHGLKFISHFTLESSIKLGVLTVIVSKTLNALYLIGWKLMIQKRITFGGTTWFIISDEVLISWGPFSVGTIYADE